MINLRAVEPLIAIGIRIDGIGAVLEFLVVGEVLEVVVEPPAAFRGRVDMALGVLRVVPARTVSVHQVGPVKSVSVEVLLAVVDAVDIGIEHFRVHRTTGSDGTQGVVVDQS